MLYEYFEKIVLKFNEKNYVFEIFFIYSGDSHNSNTSSAFDFDNIGNYENLSPIINRQNSEISLQRSQSSSATVQQEMRNVGKSVPYDPEISSCFLKRDDFKRHLEKFTKVYRVAIF